MNLGEFKTQISGNIRRSTSLDSRIPAFIRQAARWVERNRTLQYMKKLAEISIDPATADTPQYIELTGTLIKSVIFFRWVAADGEYIYLKSEAPHKFTSLEKGTPRYYWLDGVSRIVLTTTPDEVLTGELQVARYSSWPTADASTHWLMDNAEDVLEARTMMNVAKYTRDPNLFATWKAILDDSLPGLYAAEEELQYQNAELVMEGR